jgi:hypothetical protein
MAAAIRASLLAAIVCPCAGKQSKPTAAAKEKKQGNAAKTGRTRAKLGCWADLIWTSLAGLVFFL